MTIPAHLILDKSSRRKRWQTIHSMLLLAVILHFSVILLMGFALYTSGKEALHTFSVSLVRGTGGSEPVGMSGGQINNPGTSLPPSVKSNSVSTETKKPVILNKISKTVITIKKNSKDEAPAYKRDPSPPVDNEYPNFNNNGNINYTNEGTNSQHGNSSGNMPGNGQGGSGGGVGQGGIPADFQGIYLAYRYNLLPPDPKVANIVREREKYFHIQETPPMLVSANFPADEKLSGVGNAQVKVTITIPAVAELPVWGIPPATISIDHVKADKMQMSNQLRQLAKSTLERSLWYPGRKNNEIHEEIITFYVMIYGTE